MQKLMTIRCMLVIIYLIASIKRLKKIKNKVEDLIISNERLQNNYDNVRSFKHDFNNIMQSIGGYIALNDMEGLKGMYDSIVKECEEINDTQSINENVINNPAIYHLINHKYIEAKRFGIKMKIEVLINLKKIKINDFDLCRMLGILIDNAIEASRECSEKFILIKFLHDNNENKDLIIIENSCNNSLIDINKIYEKGFSSKKERINHGLGLWKVKEIIRKNSNVRLHTMRDELFKQQLEIY